MDLVTLALAGTLVTSGAGKLPLATCLGAEQVSAIAMSGIGLPPAGQLIPIGPATRSYLEAKPSGSEAVGADQPQANAARIDAAPALDAVKPRSDGEREP
jgi:hypothetical protein